jgi:hypothetical protein
MKPGIVTGAAGGSSPALGDVNSAAQNLLAAVNTRWPPIPATQHVSANRRGAGHGPLPEHQ